MEMVRPDFLPVTVMVISFNRERRSFRGSLRVGLLLMQNLLCFLAIDDYDFPFDVIAHGLDSGLMPGGLVMLLSGFPVFVGVGGLHDKLVAVELEGAREVFADEGAHECALDVVGEGMNAFVDLV